MPPYSELPGEIDRNRFVRGLRRIGFLIDATGGKGSHIKVIWTNQKSVTIPFPLRKNRLKYILKEIEDISGVTWERIKGEL